MATSLKAMMEAANASVPRLTPEQAKDMMGRDNVVVVDVRDAKELDASGKVAGAVHIPRGLLEFKADPDSPARDPNLDTDKTVILYCGSGGRSALAGKTLQDLGYTKVYNLGAFKDWAESGGPIDRV
ncbi:MAG: rhodanese-like domain-containing protein [Pseudorhodoplanes sp.]|uniref:rhodanese-like domain-containing protein n=1 Tax=Pseudorhodoplanes sp. TaxID=1934341 RepID=UPI003D14F71D